MGASRSDPLNVSLPTINSLSTIITRQLTCIQKKYFSVMSRKYQIQNNESFYFVTFTVVDWIDIFTKQAHKNVFVESVIYCQIEKGLLVGAWCIMTNHVHMIIASSGEQKLSDTIRDLKSYTSRQIRKHLEYSNSQNRRTWILPLLRKAGIENSRNKDFQLWQQHNNPIEICTNEILNTRLNYIHNNPVKAGFVQKDYQWLYSSAGDYSGIPGLIDIYFLD